jgi:predicted TIM-barrel fold metal-dependent hydrolase
MSRDLKLDIFPHIFPQAYFERVKKIAAGNPALAATIMRWLHIPVLWNLDARKTMMKQFKGYKQVLTLSLPAIEFLAGPEESPALARLANEGMAEIVAQSPDSFPAFVASLPMNNVPAALAEMDYAITRLGAKGIQVFTNVNGRPLDDPEFYPVFERCVKRYDLPIWLHPARTSKFADYPVESKSKYEIWWLFGWPYETSACMARIVFSGMLQKLPDMKIITHRAGHGPDGAAHPRRGLLRAAEEAGQAAVGLFQDVLRRYFGQRLGAGAPLRAGLLRRRSRAVRHRLPVRPGRRAGLHPRQYQGNRLARPAGPGRAQDLLRERHEDAAPEAGALARRQAARQGAEKVKTNRQDRRERKNKN